MSYQANYPKFDKVRTETCAHDQRKWEENDRSKQSRNMDLVQEPEKDMLQLAFDHVEESEDTPW